MSISTRALAAIVVLALLGCSGCAAPTMYRWGEYQDLLYEMYAEPGNAPPEKQAEVLARQIGETRAKEQWVPPGVHAHLGYMYFLLGNEQAAAEQFEEEKAAFPESAVFIDGLLGRMAGSE